MKNVILTVFVAVMLAVLGAGPLSAQTEDDFTVTLTNDGQGVLITKYTGKVTAVVIPALIQGMPVREIGARAFSEQRQNGPMITIIRTSITSITSVVIPSGVTQIGDSAFSGQNQLASVTLPPTVTQIGGSAFSETAITEIVLPATLASLGNGIFQNCSKLEKVTFPDGMRVIGNEMFSGTAISSITLPDSITSIGSSAFNRTKLVSIIIPDGVTEIGSSAFKGTKLASIIIPDGVTEIGEGAFGNIKELISVTLPSSIKSIGKGAFKDCDNLATVIIPDTVETISFDYNQYMPGKFGNFSFMGCTKLTLTSQAALRRVGYSESPPSNAPWYMR